MSSWPETRAAWRRFKDALRAYRAAKALATIQRLCPPEDVLTHGAITALAKCMRFDNQARWDRYK